MNASVIVCDDLRFEANGKLFIIGMYTGNIVIPQENTNVHQIMFLFNVDCPIDGVPSRVLFEITLPGGEPQRNQVDLLEPPKFKPEHTRWYMRHAIGVNMPVLCSGKIKASAWVDDREIQVSTPWIEVAQQMPLSFAETPIVSQPSEG